MSDRNYQVEAKDSYTILKLGSNLSYKESKDFEGEIDSLSNIEGSHFLVDCEKISSLPKEWIRSLLRLQINLKTNDKILKLIHLNKAFQVHLKEQGLEDTFKTALDIQDAIGSAQGKQKHTLDTEFINPFLTATMHVLKVQASQEVSAGKIYIKKPNDKTSGDISGIIGIVSDAFNGSVVISFPEATFLKIMSSMLGEEYTSLSQDIIDGAGELTNMIFGQAKIVLNEKGYGIKTAIPSVITGKDHSTNSLTHGPIVVVPFSGACGPFMVEICLSK